MKSFRVCWVVWALVGALLGATAAFAGGSASTVTEPGASYVIGPQRVADALNGTVLEVPKGWFAIVPLKGVAGASTLANYDMAHAAQFLPAKSNHLLLREMAKIDVVTFDLGNSSSVREWMNQRYAGNGDAEEAILTSRKMAVKIAGRQGLATVLHLGFASSLEIALPLGKNRILLANVAPVDTIDLDAALAVIDRVRDQAGTSRPKLLSSAAMSNLSASLHNLIDSEIEKAGDIEKLQSITAKAAACTSWTGSDNGTCATGMSCASTASITLFLPFQQGTFWTAGGAGSFYGNFYHGNCNVDYYAIDFNQYSASNCAPSSALNEIGQNVYAAAAGTATIGTFSSTGYGNNVIVTHSNGYKTRYAHLSSIKITSGQAVTDQTVVGLAGDSGSAAGFPHVHLSYMNSSNQSFCNKSGGCPNGEAARSPQTQRPSPMVTLLGTKAMADGSCYEAP